MEFNNKKLYDASVNGVKLTESQLQMLSDYYRQCKAAEVLLDADVTTDVALAIEMGAEIVRKTDKAIRDSCIPETVREIVVDDYLNEEELEEEVE